MLVGDRYAGEWPREGFRNRHITYEPSAKPKSDLYRDLLPLLNSGEVDLLDHQHLLTQLVGLERRTARGGCSDDGEEPTDNLHVHRGVDRRGPFVWLLYSMSWPTRRTLVFGRS